jgi:hypothetical protein
MLMGINLIQLLRDITLCVPGQKFRNSDLIQFATAHTKALGELLCRLKIRIRNGNGCFHHRQYNSSYTLQSSRSERGGSSTSR